MMEQNGELTDAFPILNQESNELPDSTCQRKAAILNFSFKGLENERKGSQKDVERLQEALKEIDYEILDDVPSTHKLEDCEDYLKSLEQGPTGMDSIMVIVMTHGGLFNNELILDDGKQRRGFFLARRLWEIFDNEKWAEVTKIFIFQACQSNVNNGMSLPQSIKVYGKDFPETDGLRTSLPPNGPNFVLAFSTIPDWAAIRSHDKGSWYIQNFVDAIQEDPTSSVLEILRKTNNKVSKEKKLDGDQVWKQMPYFTTTLAQDETFYFIQPDDEVFDDQDLEDEIEEYKQKLKRSEKEKDDQEQRADEAEEMNRKLKKEETYQHLNELLRQQFFDEFTKSKNEKSKKNKGIMGDVYSIENRPWVVKQVPGNDFLYDPIKDLEIMRTLKHESILAVLAYYYQDDGQIILFFPKAPFGSFETFVHTVNEKEKNHQEALKKEEKDFFTQDKFWDFLWHMAFALQYLHQVIHKPHGSVNPHNIFGVEKDGRVCWKLAKYGLRMTKDEYRAPEVRYSEERTKEADIYSLGAVVKFYMNRGGSPFPRRAHRDSDLSSVGGTLRRQRTHKASLNASHGPHNTQDEKNLIKKIESMMHEEWDKRPNIKHVINEKKKK